MDNQIIQIGRDGSARPITREWIGEAPVAMEFNGLAYAVMMATPADLGDFVRGFALTEGLATHIAQVGDVSISHTDRGIIARAQLDGIGMDQLAERVRKRVAESSCGLCGVENLDALAKPLPSVPPHQVPGHQAIFRALGQMGDLQQLNRSTGAAHAAAFATLQGDIHLLREDVGRHNAIDKLVGALAMAGAKSGDLEGVGQMEPGFFISTARCSYEIVEKVVKAGGSTLITISLPTSLAIERARQAGLTLFCLARDDSFLKISE